MCILHVPNTSVDIVCTHSTDRFEEALDRLSRVECSHCRNDKITLQNQWNKSWTQAGSRLWLFAQDPGSRIHSCHNRIHKGSRIQDPGSSLVPQQDPQDPGSRIHSCQRINLQDPGSTIQLGTTTGSTGLRFQDPQLPQQDPQGVQDPGFRSQDPGFRIQDPQFWS